MQGAFANRSVSAILSGALMLSLFPAAAWGAIPAEEEPSSDSPSFAEETASERQADGDLVVSALTEGLGAEGEEPASGEGPARADLGEAPDGVPRVSEEELAAAWAEAVAACVAEGSALSEAKRALWLHDWIIDRFAIDEDSPCTDAASMLASGQGTGRAFTDAYQRILEAAGIASEAFEEDGLCWIVVMADGEEVPVDIARNAIGVRDEGDTLAAKHRFFGIADGANADADGSVGEDADASAGAASAQVADAIRAGASASLAETDGMAASAAFVEAQLAADEKSVTIVASGGAFDRASAVSFPTWSTKGGQDDLVWYAATKEDGAWTSTVSLASHRTLGSYAVHAYGVVDGIQTFLGSAAFEVSAPKASVSISQSADQIARCVFQVDVTVEHCPAGVVSMQLPTWSAAGGQDDIVWYAVARPVGDAATEWTIEVPCVAPDRAPGLYVSHVYVSMGNGILSYAGSASEEVEAGADTALAAELSADEAAASLRGSGEGFARATAVSFAVWSLAGGQDDIVWYPAVRNARNEWAAQAAIARHRTAGDYAVHAYATIGGSQRMVAAASFSVAPTQATAAISQSADQIARGVFQVSVEVLACPSGVARMQAPTWSEAGGQDDIVWYDVPRPASGDATPWTIEVPCAAPNREPGAYLSHIYITTNNGLFACAAQASGSAELGPAHIEAHTSDGELTFVIEAYGGDFARASALSVPTWSFAGGQDDIVWYGATRKAAGWTVSVPIRNHRTAGEYLAHAYGTVGGTQRFLGATSFAVSAPTATVEVAETGNGFYVVATKDAVSPSGVAFVAVPSWTEPSGQDDIVWHAAAHAGAGVWECRIEAGTHGGQDGTYLSHAYLTASNGVQVFVGAVSADVACRDYVFVTGAAGAGKRMVWIKNPSAIGAVQMPTWSLAGGQDDIVWYQASHAGANLWGAEVDCARLRHAGTVVTHVYVGGQMAGATSFVVSENDIARYRGVGVLASIINAATGGFGTFNVAYDMNSPNGRWLQSAIRNVTAGGRNLGIMMIDLKTGRGLAYNANAAIYSASSIKGPYVAAINKFYPWTVGGGTASTMGQTIGWSSNEGYASLRRQYGAGPMSALQRFVGATSFPSNYNYVDISAKDMAKLWVGCYDYFFENTNERSAWCRSLYTDPLLSFIRQAHAGRYATYSKPGSLNSGGRYVARDDAGIVMAGDRPYVVVVLSTAFGRDGALTDLVNALDAVHADMVR